MKKVCIIGLGYIGLPTACILLNKGFEVVGVDIDQKLVKELNQGDVDNPEPELGELVSSATKSSKPIAKISPEEADIFMLCVPTPLTDEVKADLACVKNAAESIAPYLREQNKEG